MEESYICNRFKASTMATTIKITPALTGKASKEFNRSLTSNKTAKVSPEKKMKMADLVRRVLSKQK